MLLAIGASGLTSTAAAHSFGVVYNLPVPFWLYAWGAVGALFASFAVLGYFVSSRNVEGHDAVLDLSHSVVVLHLGRFRLWSLARVLSVFILLFCIATGLWGIKSPYQNFNMTWFWILFVLLYAWLQALFGDLYARISPWKVLTDWIGRFWRGYSQGLVSYPRWLSYWPALLLYMGFIWIELFGGIEPAALSLWLLGYSGLNLLAVGLFGQRDWFRYGEFFAVFLRLLALMAPLQWQAEETGSKRLLLVWPFTGLLAERADAKVLLVFVLFMLSSTAFDGLHEAKPWVELYWTKLYVCIHSCEPGVGIAALDDWFLSLQAELRIWAPSNPLAAFGNMRGVYEIWQTTWLLLSPFIYLAIFLLFCLFTKWAGRSALSVWQVAQRFCYSLLPIALVYHVTHYYTLIQTQGVKIFALASDPFGYGWDLFGTKDWFYGVLIPDPGTTWHVQVGLIVFGHIVSVWLAHREALRTFASHKLAVMSQIPMLILMMLFTTVGLWILSLPIKSNVGY